MENLSDTLLKAAILKCQAEVEAAKATIALYTTSPVGVGEHPDIVEEILKAAENGAAAQEKLDFLSEVSPRAAFFIEK
tara:strand:+ start:2736 stop:2969 length:234 start_codon:yes stop_codon:yes gene_type:complete